MTAREVGPGHTGEEASVQRAPTAARLASISDVAITVVHGSLDHATYALMVGSFAGEQLSPVERFVDRQFAGLLSSWVELDRYPTALGTSRFIPPARTEAAETEPPGCYVIGLGPFAQFGRAELTHAVRGALLDRCLSLYQDAPEACSLRVGVSSTLIGVGSDEGLRVEDSVAAIVEGLLHANAELERHETARPDGGVSVRVTALEFIDRFADRANLAAVAVRSLATKVRLKSGHEALRGVIVEHRDGGLPIGATLTDYAQRWRRFLITKASTDGLGPAAVDDPHHLVLDVSLLGREARADRVRHSIDSVLVDALVDEISKNTADRRTSATLYEQLVPQVLEAEFQTSAAVQFVVDPVTASFPWELLTAPWASGREALAESGAVMRQFAESDDRRLNPVRSVSGRALIVAAGNVAGLTELPGVHVEGRRIAELLRAGLGADDVDELSDRTEALDLVRLQNALFGDHQILHIASHGVYNAGQPGATGAVLSVDGLLTANLVRQLRWVPDVVFLNACSLGKVGMSRMAAGLAREFMAIGARAVVAAAWAVDDAAARAFAVTFYDELLAGRPLGDTVARARVACAEEGGGETWAAYQCYGDPGFVVRGTRQVANVVTDDPVSGTDLAARLGSLAVRTADLGLAGRGAVAAGRKRLRAAWERLAAWVAEHPEHSTEAVQRQLGAIARDLGDFAAAAARLTPLVVRDDAGGRQVRLLTRKTLPEDLQQAANCLARAAQREAQAAIAAGDEASRRNAMDRFDEAIALANAAIEVLPELESYAVLGGTLRRQATVAPERRHELLEAALDAYRQASASAPTIVEYAVENARQLALLLDVDTGYPAPAEPAVVNTAPPVSTANRLVDQRRAPPAAFWARVHAGDRALTRLLAATDSDERAAAAKEMTAAYCRSFASRSTWSQRQTVISNLADMRDLLEGGDPRSPLLSAALADLVAWDEAAEP